MSYCLREKMDKQEVFSVCTQCQFFLFIYFLFFNFGQVIFKYYLKIVFLFFFNDLRYSKSRDALKQVSITAHVHVYGEMSPDSGFFTSKLMPGFIQGLCG